jgi:parvulin-like peptidyl-prolyl isomerase
VKKILWEIIFNIVNNLPFLKQWKKSFQRLAILDYFWKRYNNYDFSCKDVYSSFRNKSNEFISKIGINKLSMSEKVVINS